MAGLRDLPASREAGPARTGAGAHESVCAMFERQCDRTPDATALLCEGRSVTYRELEAHAGRLARRLRTRYGIGAESVVGLLLGRSERMLIGILAVLKAGGAYVPISPEYPRNRVAWILRDADPALVITEDRCADLVADHGGEVVSWDDPAASWENEPADRLDGDPAAHDLAYIMYTSGSTGRPKGVMLEHGNLSNFIAWCREEYSGSRFEIVYAATPYGFDLSNVELFFPLAVGRPIRLLPTSQVIGLYLRRDRDVLLNTVPSLAQEMLKTDGIFASVSVLNLGGEAVPQSLANALAAYPRLEVRNMYGPTETTSTAINYRMDGAPAEILIGKPIANTVAYVLDDALRRVPLGEKGEICIGGRGVSRGYRNLPELTRERFVPDPFRPGERIYRTGDVGAELPDGNFRYFGRNDNQVKLRGFRIELDEIGAQLASHRAVRDAVAGVRAEGDAGRLVAVLSLREPASIAELLAFLRERLPPYMVPDELEIRAALPLAPTGKIDRAALFGGKP